MERALDRRVARFSDFRRFISKRAQGHFSMLLSQRGYSGKLIFEHADEELLIVVSIVTNDFVYMHNVYKHIQAEVLNPKFAIVF